MNRYTLLLAGLALLAGHPAGALESAPRTVTVSGSGEVRATPDQATVTLGVSARGATVIEARARGNKAVPALLALTRELNVPESNVRSTELSVNPEVIWDPKLKTRRVTGYRIERRLVIELKQLEHLGELLEKSLSLGANVLEEPELDSSRRKDLEREALALAFADAKRNAEVLATASGGTVGEARQIAMAGTQAPHDKLLFSVAAPPPREAPAATYRVGELSFGAEVQATFELLAGAVAH